MNKKNKYDIGLRYAMAGIKAAYAGGKNFRIQTVFGITAILLGFLLRINEFEFLAVLIVTGLVLTCEAFNSAIEAVCDFICSEFNDKIKTIKDVAAGAVLISSILSLIVGLIIFLPKIWTLVFGWAEV